MTNDEPGEQLFVVYESDLREMGPGDAWPTDSDTWTVVRLAQKTQGASRDASSAEELPPMRFKDWARDIRTQGLLAEIRALKSSHPKYCDDPPTSRSK